MNKKIRQNLFPVLTALIWGTAFVAQSVSAEHVPPLTFGAIRCSMAFAALALGLTIVRMVQKKRNPERVEPLAKSPKDLLLGGLCCGVVMATANFLQQTGLSQGTSVGKAGFITALYIVLVPILGLFLHKKVTVAVWISVALAAVGLYFLCMNEALTIEKSDLMVMLCSLAFAVHILVIDNFTQKVNGVALSTAQFAVAAVVSGIAAALTETPTLAGIKECIWPLLYVGVMSGGVGYTLQILAQKDANPTVVSLLLSLESVFSVIAGAVILHDRLTGRELLGCGLMMLAVILAQLPARSKVAEQANN